MRVLLVKMSSLGDVVHALPALTDAAAHGISFDWVVEEAFAPIAERHPAVRRVIPIAWRRWRRSLLRSHRQLADFTRDLRRDDYDLVLDAQGLWKSALVSRLAGGAVVAGFDRHTAREGSAASLYRRRLSVPRNQHAVDRLRQLFAAALGYRVAGPADAGLQNVPDARSDPAARICVLCHGTTWSSKHWPVAMWQQLAGELQKLDYQLHVPAGTPEELRRAWRIVECAGPSASVLDRPSLAELMTLLASASLVVGVDSGLAHLAGALGAPTVVMYGSTDAELTGCRGPRVSNLQASLACSPCRARACAYRGAPQLFGETAVTPACYASLPPAVVLRAAAEI